MSTFGILIESCLDHSRPIFNLRYNFNTKFFALLARFLTQMRLSTLRTLLKQLQT